MDRRRLLAGIVWAVFAVFGSARAAWAECGGSAGLGWDEGGAILEGDPQEGDEVQPNVDCSEGRPDRDCLSGRQGATQTSQTCGGVAVVFGAGSCSVTCGEGYYACGKCGWGGFAMCTCRMNFTCDPHAP